MSEPAVQVPPAPFDQQAPRPPAGPVVLSVRPRVGWRQASTAQRVAALCPPVVLLLLWPGSLIASQQLADRYLSSGSVDVVVNTVFTLLWLFGGPPAYFAAARILRPYPGGDGGRERVFRHAGAALGASYGTLVLLGGGPTRAVEMSLAPVDVWWFVMLVASAAGVITLVWGGVAAIVRAGDRRALQI